MKPSSTLRGSMSMSLASGSTYGSESNGKYNGMIKQSPIKVLRNRFFSLLTYFDSVVPNFYPMHAIVSVWRIVQFLGPCLCPANLHLWNPDNASSRIPGKVVSIISILFHIVPVEYRAESSVILELIYIVLNVLFFIAIFSGSIYYKNKAKLERSISIIFSVYINVFGYLLPSICLNISGETIGRLIQGYALGFGEGFEIAMIVLSIIVFAVWFWFFEQIAIVSFLFRPNSLISVLHFSQIFLYLSTIFINFLLGIASQLSALPSGIVTFIVAILYGATVLCIYIPGTFISQKHQTLIMASCFTGCVYTVLVGVEVIVGREADFIEFFIFIALFIIAYIISNFVLSAHVSSNLRILDHYQENNITIDYFKSPTRLISVITTGMKYGHPVCIDWSIFRDGTDKFPDSSLMWCVFGKFVAIYPDEDNILTYIIHSMINHKIHGNLAKQSIAQANNIAKQRDLTLSPNLKAQLNKNSKQVSVTKRKIRHVWDLVIQGTVNEMESCINNAYKSVNKSRSNFNHLLSQYPNNRFVARSYYRFLVEVEGDTSKIAEWSERVRNLQRGQRVCEDRAFTLGTHVYPDLPREVHANQNLHQLGESESITSEIVDMNDDGNAQVSNDQLAIIRERINTLNIPATIFITAWTLVMYFCLILAPLVGMMCFAPSYLNSMTDPLQYMYHLSYLRSLNFQLPIFAHHLVFEEMKMFPIPNVENPPQAYGYQTSTREMIKFMLTEATTSLNEINQYESFNRNDPTVSKAHEIVFGGQMSYSYFTAPNTYTIVNYTLQQVMTDYTTQINLLLETPITWDVMDAPMMLNPYLNFNSVASSVSSALSYLEDYLAEYSSNITNMVIFIALFVSFTYILIMGGMIIYQVSQLSKCKTMIYKCLIALPKNVVSTISESLRVLKKDEDASRTTELDTEISKHEENVLKILASVSDTTSIKSAENTTFVVFDLIIIVLTIVCIVLIAQMFPSATNTLRDNAPHLDYVLGASGYSFSVFGAIDNLVATTNDHGLSNDLNVSVGTPGFYEWLPELVSRGRQRTTTFNNYYQYSRFGREATATKASEPPYSKFHEYIAQAAASSGQCVNEVIYPESVRDLYRCMTAEFQVNIFEPLTEIIFAPVIQNNVTWLDPEGELFNELWNMVTINLYDSLFYPMFQDIVPTMQDMLDQSIITPRTGVIIILVVIFIFVVLILNEVHTVNEKMNFALSLLLHCPPAVVMQTSKIVDLLAGDFSSRSRDLTTRNTEFFDNIVDNLPNSIIITTPEGIIEKINKATKRIYGIDPEKFVNTNANEFFTTQNFSEEIENIHNNEPISVEYQHGQDTKMYLSIIRLEVSRNIVYESRDKTQEVLYNTLISEEKEKSDQLLSSILPANLVKRVAAGEKNISFAVQSATILFLDIVEFTPWCASLTAAVVMQTLNRLFRMFDARLAPHETMTKIKCIGDCYMAAGGIFSEINQPAVHAKEVCEFGLESIDAIEENNREHDMSLRIRVGINTGGPIVAGVLGTEKPTFEILGPAINMAQQMEHNGVPMKVHISRSVYELIYGGSFNVKERGQIQIKNGSVLTYLIEH